ncbi:MAG: hypothetical protein K2X47_12415 [Bdellovibrionales bacterium]|nr:hypothetical protein [Bdellovibrionales bacterium]
MSSLGCAQQKGINTELPLTQAQREELAVVTDSMKEMDGVIRSLPLGKPANEKPSRVQAMSELLRGCSVEVRLPQAGDANLSYLKIYRRISGTTCAIEHDFSIETFRYPNGNRLEQIRAAFQVRSSEYQAQTKLKAFRFEGRSEVTNKQLAAQFLKTAVGAGQGSIDFFERPSVGIQMSSKEEVKISTGFQEGAGYSLTILSLPGTEIQASVVEQMNGVDMRTQAFINQKEVTLDLVQSLRRALWLGSPQD